MMQKISTFFTVYRRFIPLMATGTLVVVAYTVGAIFYDGMRDPQIFLNLFNNSPYLLISSIGSTFVILTGGIDLSVSGVVALTSTAAAALLREGWNPWLVILLMLLMGMAIGAIMGTLITYLKVQPFIATLAGMWIARGLCFFISDNAIPIDNRIFRILGQTKILIPGLSDPATKSGDFITILVVVAFLVLIAAMILAHLTPFGRTVYALGGNEQSARLMGLPVDRTKVLVYTLNGFCSALAGIVYSIYVMSGHGLYAQTFELVVIASVVMGGTMLSGGVGYIFGTQIGVLITGVTQTLIQFNGQLSSWWTNIVVGLLTLVFIGIQSIFVARQIKKDGSKDQARDRIARLSALTLKYRKWLAVGGGAAVVLIVLTMVVVNLSQPACGEAGCDSTPAQSAGGCQFLPFRQDLAAQLLQGGAIITYERNGGPNCIDEVYAFYPDGRITGDSGSDMIETAITLPELEELLIGITDRGWFTNELYDTWHTPCRQCYGYYITVFYKGESKTVKAVDGGTDAPANYWQVVSLINGIIPKFPYDQ